MRELLFQFLRRSHGGNAGNASKRYALFNLDTEGSVSVRKYSEHGLGAYEDPRDPDTGERVRKWEREVWHYLIGRPIGQSVVLPAWAHQPALTQVRISTPEQLRWFDTYNRTPRGDEKLYAERVKPFNFLGHAMARPLTALPHGASPDRFCLVAPAGEQHWFVNRHDPKGDLYTAGVDFTPKTYADLIESYDRHPERKFAGPDGQPCQSGTQGLLQDLPLVVSGVRHVGKEGNELKAHQAGLLTEAERQLQYHDSAFDDLVAKLQQISTKVIVDATEYNPRTVRRLKRGEFRPCPQKFEHLTTVALGRQSY